MKLRSVLLALGFAAALMASVPAGAQIVSHRAAYSLSLGAARANSGITAVEGAMVFDWQEVCEGWTLNQRMSFRIFDSDGQTIDNDISFSSFEARNGSTYRFSVRTSIDNEVTEQLRGRAELGGDGRGGRAIFSEPDGETVELPPGTVFPTEHTRQLIERAAAGDRQMGRLVFDGATLDGAFDTNAVISQPLTREPPRGPSIDASLLAGRSWRVRIAYFKTSDGTSEPDYELSMRLFENGVGADFLFEYGEFSIRARLDRLDALPRPRC
jgi:hypothetical protein